MSIHTGVLEMEGPLVARGLRHLTVLDSFRTESRSTDIGLTEPP